MLRKKLKKKMILKWISVVLEWFDTNGANPSRWDLMSFFSLFKKNKTSWVEELVGMRKILDLQVLKFIME